MKRSIFRPIIFGILAGAAIFFFGFFLLRILLVFLLVGAVIRFFLWAKWGGKYRHRRAYFKHVHPGDAYTYAKGTVIHLRSKEDKNIIHID